MEKQIIQVNGITIAIVYSNEQIIIDAQSALDFMVTIDYNDGCDRTVINKQAIIEDFFKLSTGIAGEILQKFINYSKKLAIVGDFSTYTSKPLRDFIYECNRGNDIFFVLDEQAAIDKLSTAK
jgi:hypothetical protein